MFNGTIPGPCAASSRTSMSRDCSSLIRASKGIRRPVGLVTVSISANLDLGVVWLRMVSITCLSFSTGKGKGTTTVLAPVFFVTKSTEFQHAW